MRKSAGFHRNNMPVIFVIGVPVISDLGAGSDRNMHSKGLWRIIACFN
jgi:hypothetical protein